MSDSPPPAAAATVRPGKLDLMHGFASIAIIAFGGVLPWAQRMVVDKRRWMTVEEFNEAFALSQFLPGPNMVNFAIVFGSRSGGVAGAIAALTGLLGPPLVIVTLLAVLYGHYGDIATLGRILTGIAAAAVGLLIAVVARMTAPMFKRRDGAALFAALAFVGVALLHWPLPLVFVVLAPFSVALAWKKTT